MMAKYQVEVSQMVEKLTTVEVDAPDAHPYDVACIALEKVREDYPPKDKWRDGDDAMRCKAYHVRRAGDGAGPGVDVDLGGGW